MRSLPSLLALSVLFLGFGWSCAPAMKAQADGPDGKEGPWAAGRQTWPEAVKCPQRGGHNKPG